MKLPLTQSPSLSLPLNWTVALVRVQALEAKGASRQARARKQAPQRRKAFQILLLLVFIMLAFIRLYLIPLPLLLPEKGCLGAQESFPHSPLSFRSGVGGEVKEATALCTKAKACPAPLQTSAIHRREAPGTPSDGKSNWTYHPRPFPNGTRWRPWHSHGFPG